MNVSVVNTALWIPFGVVFFISALRFCITGYKRGLWRGLVSFGATLLAGLFSLWLTRLMAGAAANSLLPVIGDAGALEESELLKPILAAGIQGVLSLLIFSIVFFLLAIFVKMFADRIATKLLPEEQKSSQWGGLGVRFVDALLYTLLLLLPLYGTTAAYLPAVSSVVAISSQAEPEQAKEIIEIMDAASSHPVTKISGQGPVALFYDGLSTVDTRHGGVNVAAAAQSLAGTMERVESIMEDFQEETVDPEKIRELISFLRTDVIRQEWCYNACMELIATVTAQPEFSGEKWEQALDIVKMNQQDFIINADALLSLAEYFLQEDVLVKLMDSENVMSALKETEFTERFGQAMNVSEQAVGARQFLVGYYLEQAELNDPALQNLIITSWGGAATQDKALQRRQGQAMLLLLNSNSGPLNILTANMCLSPEVEQEVREYVMNAPLSELFPDQVIQKGGVTVFIGTPGDFSGMQYDPETGTYSYDASENPTVPEDSQIQDDRSFFFGWSLVEEYLGGEQALREKLWDLMRTAAEDGIEGNVEHYFNAYLKLSNLGSTIDTPICHFYGDTMNWALDALGEEYFQWLKSSGKVSGADISYQLAAKTAQMLEDDQLDWIVGMDDSLWALCRLLEDFDEADMGYEMEETARKLLSGSSAGMVARSLVDELGPDPLGAGKFLSSDEKQTLLDYLNDSDSYYADDEDEMSVAERKEAILAFLGIE